MITDARKEFCLKNNRLCIHVMNTLKRKNLSQDDKEKYLKSIAVLHHIDNNSKNNPEDGSNWMILCRGCNHTLHPRGQSKRGIRVRHKLHVCMGGGGSEGEREKTYEDTDGVKMSGEMKKSIICVPKFEKFLELLIRKFTVMVVEDFVNASAKELNLSQNTVKRYLNREVNPYNGKYEYFLTPDNERCIRLRSDNL